MPLLSKLSTLFRSPPAEVPAAAAQAAAQPAVPPPHRLYQTDNNNNNTLSRVFTQLPQSLPNYADVYVDLIEWLMHVALLQTDPYKLMQDHMVDIAQALNNIEEKLPYGRLYNRVELTALYADVCGRKTEPNELGPGLPASVLDTLPAFELTQWAQFRKDLAHLRLKLIRKDANLVVPVLIQNRRSSLCGDVVATTRATAFDCEDTEGEAAQLASNAAAPPPANPELDMALEQHEMMQADYHQVMQLLAIQEALANLQMELQNIQETRPREQRRKIEEALQVYDGELKLVFGGGGGEIPRQLELTAAEKRTPSAMVLMQAIQDVCLNDDDPYSHAQLQDKMRALLIKWSEHILEIPALFAVGYRGVIAPVVGKDVDDDVSSFGHGDDTQLMTQAPEPLPLHRSKFVKTSTKEDGFGSTPEEQRVLQQLSRGTSPPRETDPLRAEAMQQRAREKEDGVFPLQQDDDDDSRVDPPVSAPRSQRSERGKENRKQTAARLSLASPGDSSDSDGDDKLDNRNIDRAPSSQPNRKIQRAEPDLWGDDSDADSQGKPNRKKRKRKNFWSDDEELAVKEGVGKFGRGRWKEIKDWAGDRLANRSAIDIKDKHRTIVRNAGD